MAIRPRGGAEHATPAAVVAGLERLEAGVEGPRSGLERAEDLARAARSLGREDLARSAAVLAADLRVRREGVGDALAEGERHLRWAQRHDATRLASRCHALLAMVHVISGDPGSGAEHATQAVSLLSGDESSRVRARLLVRQAVGLFVAGLLEHASTVTREALAIAEDLDDADLVSQLAANALQAAVDHDQLAEAREWAALLESALERRPDLRPGAADLLARAYLADDRPDAALAVLSTGDPDREEQAEADHTATWHLLLAVAQRRLGRLDAATGALQAAADLAREGRLAEIAVHILEERAALAAARGDHRTAYELHRRFHREDRARRLAATGARAAELFAEQRLDDALRRAAEAEQASTRDHLTGVRNRRWLQQDLSRSLREWHRAGTRVAVGVLDLDRFKRINDDWGHDVGDRVLRDVARCLSDASGVVEVARLGGDELVLVLLGHPERWRADAEEALAAVRALSWIEQGTRLSVTASLGLAEVDGTVADALDQGLREADRRLYRAKARGRDVVEGPWTPDLAADPRDLDAG